jgi:hypothetical protein
MGYSAMFVPPEQKRGLLRKGGGPRESRRGLGPGAFGSVLPTWRLAPAEIVHWTDNFLQ